MSALHPSHSSKLACMILVMLCAITHMWAGEYDVLRIGGYAGWSSVQHSASFSSLPGYLNQFAPYTNSSSTGFLFGGSAQYFVSPRLGVQCGLGFQSFGATLGADEFIGNQERNGSIFSVYSHHSLVTKLGTLALEPSLLLRPFPAFPLTLLAGVDYGVYVQKSFVQTESLSQEAINNGYRFIDQNGQPTTVRQKGSGTLPQVNNDFSYQLGLQYLVALNSASRLGLSLHYQSGLRDVVQNCAWKVQRLELRAEFYTTLRTAFIADPLPEPQAEPQPTIAKDSVVVAAVNKEVPEKQHPKTEPEAEKTQIKTEPKQEAKQEVKPEAKPETKPEPKREEPQHTQQQTQQTERRVRESDSVAAKHSQTARVDTASTQDLGACCVIILYTSESKSTARRVLAQVQVVSSEELHIQPWFDKADHTTYYRVQSACHSYDDALRIKNSMELSAIRLHKVLSPILKCD